MVRKSIIRLRGRKELYNIGGLSNILAAYCVAGHHAGLPDGGAPGEGAGTPTLHGRMAKELEDYSDFLKEIEIPKIPVPPLKIHWKEGWIQSSVLHENVILLPCRCRLSGHGKIYEQWGCGAAEK